MIDRTSPARNLAELHRQRRLVGAPELRLIEPTKEPLPALATEFLCDFLLGLSIDQIAEQYRTGSTSVQDLMRCALHQYFTPLNGR